MNEVLLISIILIMLIMIVQAWFIFEHYKFKKKLALIQQYLEQNDMDLSGLCSAAVEVDKKIFANHEQVAEISERLSKLEQQAVNNIKLQPETEIENSRESEDLSSYHQHIEEPETLASSHQEAEQESSVELSQDNQSEQPVQPYQQAIKAVKEGVSTDELMQQFSLSRDEALLLIRLHGGKV